MREPREGDTLTNRFDEALVYAGRAHARQLRKGTSIPYVAHLLGVAALVLEDGGGETEAIAALLHDAPEDQGGLERLEDIRRRFGDEVARIVDGCTDTYESPKPEWRGRKERYLERLLTEPPEVLRVSLADKLHNARAVLADYRRLGEELWPRFNAGRDHQLWYYESLVDVFRKVSSSPMVDELESVVRELLRLAPAAAAPLTSSPALPTDLEFVLYHPPGGDPIELPMAPRLESWDSKSHPSQIALQKYLDEIQRILGPSLREATGELAIELVVGLPQGTDLLTGGRDLDNYLYPIVRRLGWRTFSSGWAAKRRGPSKIRIGSARPVGIPYMEGWEFAGAEPLGSADKQQWKASLAEQLSSQARTAPPGPLEVQVCFRLGKHRDWAYLWKQAIDSLGPIVGEGSRPFHPQDDRIVRLGLHRVIDDSIGHRVKVGIWWRHT